MHRRSAGVARSFALLLAGVLCRGAFAEEVTLIADAHVDAARPTSNSGAISNVNVGGGYTGLLQFDLSLLPAGTTSSQVSRAVLRLYVNRVDTPGVVSLQPLNSGWSEYGVTFATLPALGSATQIFNVSQAGSYVAIDVTTLVQGWIARPSANNGVALTAGTAVAQFDSKENDLTAHAAALDVQLVSQGPAGLPGAPGAAGPAGPSGSQGPAGVNGARGASGFTYQGVYDSTKNYVQSDVVVFQGSSYISLTASNHGNSPALSPLQWGLVAAAAPGGTGGGGGTAPVAAGIAYQGNYSSTANYALNDIVLYQSSSYISLSAGNHGNSPSASPSTWGILAVGGTQVGPPGPAGPAGAPGAQGVPGLGFAGAYNSATNYGLNDAVSFQGSSYISLTAANHGNTPGQVPAAWALLAAAGASVAGPAGAVGPVGPAGLQGLQGVKGDAGAAGPAGATGTQGAPGLVYQGAYASATNYALGDVVLWQGASYTSLSAGNHGNTPSVSPAQWGTLTVQGPPGAVGATGLQGAAGPVGALGPTGPPGDRGAQGAQGIGGQAGAQGLTGPQGAAGLSGPMGPQGLPGPVGLSYQGTYRASTNYALADGVLFGGASYVSLIAGNHGNTPDTSPAQWALFAAAGGAGATGPAGLTGASGPQGPQGPAGVPGAAGATGVQGPQGPAALRYTGNYASATNYTAADAVSFGGSTYVSLAAGNHGNTPDVSPAQWAVLAAQGLQGAAGAAGAPGPTGPAGTIGAPGMPGAAGPPLTFTGGWANGRTYATGDAVSYAGGSFIALSGNTGRQPDVSPAVWGSLAQAGGAGPVGPAGATGLQGPTGFAGPAGASGPAGPTGSSGPAGSTGPAGATGAAGPVGARGIPGVAGLTFRGVYSSATNYAMNDGVTQGGSTYLSLADSNAGNSPAASPSFWSLLAAAGTPGANGAAGVNGTPGANGATGASGAAGPAGPAGPQGANGLAGLAYQGAYAPSSNYALNDAVTYLGSSYISLLAGNHGNTPNASPSQWGLLAQQGGAGVAGATGPAGASGSAGAAGPAGAQGPAGARGATGIVFRGTWVTGSGYAVGDAVTFNGSTYQAQVANASVQPDSNASVWAVLAASGAAGPTGAAGSAASLQVGTVTTGAAGSSVVVNNRGTAAAAILDFTIPQGATGAAGTGGSGGGGGTSGIPFVSMYHGVSFNATYYSLSNTNQGASETASVLTWTPTGCSATQLVVFSQQGAAITVTLRSGAPGALADTTLSCQVATGQSCTATGAVAIPAGGFVDLGITHSNSTAAGVWAALTCN